MVKKMPNEMTFGEAGMPVRQCGPCRVIKPFVVKSVWEHRGTVPCRTQWFEQQFEALGSITGKFSHIQRKKRDYHERSCVVRVVGTKYSFERVFPRGRTVWHILKDGERIGFDITSNKVLLLLKHIENRACRKFTHCNGAIAHWIEQLH